MYCFKFYKKLALVLTLVLVGCGKEHSNLAPNELVSSPSEITPPIEGTPPIEDTSPIEGTPPIVGKPLPKETLLFANPIDDINLIADATLNFKVPAGSCFHSDGAAISYQMEITNNVGFNLVNDNQLSGVAKEMGVVNVVVTCRTERLSATDEFTISVTDFEIAPSVHIAAPQRAKVNEIVSLTAVAQDNNVFGSIISYEWIETSNLGIAITDAGSATATFTAPDTNVQSKAIFSVTVTDNDGATAIDTIEIDLISTLAPSVSLSFPLSFGVYNQDNIDMFGVVEPIAGDGVASVVINVDNVDYTASVTNNTWRVENITLTDKTDIEMYATSTNGFINYAEVNLVNHTKYLSAIDNNVSDIAINEITDEIYVQLDGGYVYPTQLVKFNLESTKNSVIDVNQPDDYIYRNDMPTSLAMDAESNTLFVSYPTAISQIDLTTGNETILSDSTKGAGTGPSYIFDLSYDTTFESLYFTDLDNRTINTVNVNTGDRSELRNSITELLSIAVDSTTGDLFYSQGITIDSQTILRHYKSSAVSLDSIYDIPAGGNGGPISDIAVNEVSEEVFFVDGLGSLIKINLSNNSITELISNLFSIGSIEDETSPMIALHYHSKRNVLIAAGKDPDGTNKLLVIDPKSGDYANVATGE